MTYKENDFIKELKVALNKHSVNVIEKWKNVLLNLPEETEAVEIVISPTQDGDGIFHIFVSLDGPDLSVLNNKINEHYQLFSPIHTKNGIEPYVPDVDPFDVDFEVNDTVVDIVLLWLESLWEEVSDENLSLPAISIYGDEGYGTKPSVQLN